MFRVSLQLVARGFARLSLAFLGIVSVATLISVSAQPQRARAQEDDRPLFIEFKGVRIGMPAEEARKKLGNPRDKGDELDFYVFNDNEAVQVYYDKAKNVSAISIDFMSGAASAPAAKDVVGAEPDARPDGSAYKMVRYPKAGYWVAYNKTAGTSPTITITMQKIEH